MKTNKIIDDYNEFQTYTNKKTLKRYNTYSSTIEKQTNQPILNDDSFNEIETLSEDQTNIIYRIVTGLLKIFLMDIIIILYILFLIYYLYF